MQGPILFYQQFSRIRVLEFRRSGEGSQKQRFKVTIVQSPLNFKLVTGRLIGRNTHHHDNGDNSGLHFMAVRIKETLTHCASSMYIF